MRAWRAMVGVSLGLVFGVHLAAADDAAIENGKRVYETWCWNCHGGGAGKPGTDALRAKYKDARPAVLDERTDLTPVLTKAFVRKGVSIMPFFRKTEISDADLDALAAYLGRNVKK